MCARYKYVIIIIIQLPAARLDIIDTGRNISQFLLHKRLVKIIYKLPLHGFYAVLSRFQNLSQN